MSDYPPHPGVRIRQLLARMRVTQKELAARIGCTPQEVNRVVGGHRRLTPRMAVVIEQALQLPVAEQLLYIQARHDVHRERVAARWRP